MLYVFADCELDTQIYVLRRAGQMTFLRPKVFQVLIYLLEHRDRVVSKHELLEAVWPAQFISDATLADCIRTIRHAVGDSRHSQNVLQTRHGHGYRFVAEVIEPPTRHQEQPESDSPAALAPRPSPPAEDAHQGQPLATIAAVGGSAPHAAAPLPQPSARPAGERKVVTILCCTLSQAPGRAAQPELDVLHSLMRELYSRARTEIQRYGGVLQPSTGNCFMVVFGLQTAQEDHAQRAVLAGLGLQRRLDEYNSTPRSSRVSLAVCLSLHTGPVVAGGMGDEPEIAAALVGDTALLAAAIQELGAPGMILCSAATAQLVQGIVHVKPLGSVRVAGQPTAVLVHHILGRSLQHPPAMPRGERGLSQLVGRARELTTLLALWNEVEDGRGQVVGVVGEPGMGKSRLIYEFRCSVYERRLTYLAGRCVSYGGTTPYLPIGDMLQYYCGLTETDTPEAMRAKICRTLQEVGMAPDEGAPLLLHLLGVQTSLEQVAALSPEARKSRTFATLIHLCIQASQQRPLVIEIENLHWIDPTSEECLATLVERVAGLPILILVTYRPGYRPAWIDRSYVTQMALQRLSPQESRQVIQSVLQSTAIAESLAQQLLVKADGNPFFLEELAWTVREHGDSQALTSVPDTIQAVLAARIDRLPPTAKYLLQAAAVIGKDVRWPLLQAMTSIAEHELRDGLRSLQAAELLYETHLVPEVIYTFKHVLTQEVALQSLLKSTRQHYHQKVAQILEERFPEHVETHPEVLAHHYTEGGLDAQALGYWQQAGHRAAQRSAYVEAISHCTQGLAALARLPDSAERQQRELALQMALAPALMTTRGYGAPEVAHAYTRAYALSQQCGDTAQRFMVLMGLYSVHLNQAQHTTAQAVAGELLTLAEHQHDPVFPMLARYTMGNSLFYLGQFAASRTYFVQAMRFYNPRHHRSLAFIHGEEPGVRCQARGILPLMLLGYPDQAQQEMQTALTMVTGQEHPYSLALCLYYRVRLQQFRREVSATAEQAATLIAFCTAHKFAHYRAQGMILRGWALAVQGHHAEGIAQIVEGLSAYQATGGRTGRPHLLALLAEAYQHAHQPAPALRLITEALAVIATTAERWWVAEMHRLHGELLLQAEGQSRLLEAEASLRRARDIARRQQAKVLELRAIMSLSRLWQRQGKRDEAHPQLAESYGWFTEGLQTADLQEARILLAELT